MADDMKIFGAPDEPESNEPPRKLPPRGAPFSWRAFNYAFWENIGHFGMILLRGAGFIVLCVIIIATLIAAAVFSSSATLTVNKFDNSVNFSCPGLGILAAIGIIQIVLLTSLLAREQ